MPDTDVIHIAPDVQGHADASLIGDAISEEKEMQQDYSFVPPEEVQRLVQPFKGDAGVGLNMDEVTYEDEKRAAYNQLSREMKKKRARDINFDQCAVWARTILEDYSKDLQVAVWLCIAELWKEGGNETERLRGFRNGLAAIKGMLDTFGTNLYPNEPAPDGEETQSSIKLKILERFGANTRLARLQDIETKQQIERFKLSEEALADFLEKKIPVAIRNDVQKNFLGETIEGAEVFTRRLYTVAFERWQKKPDSAHLAKMVTAGFIEEAEMTQAVEYYASYIIEAARLPVDYPEIEFCISDYTLRVMRRHALPEVFDAALEKQKHLSTVREDIFRAKLERTFRTLKKEMEAGEVEHYRSLLIDLSNQNRWLFLEIRQLMSEIKTVLHDLYGEQSPSFKKLEAIIAERAAESEALIEQKAEEEEGRQAALKERLAALEQQVRDLEMELNAMRTANQALKLENEKLQADLAGQADSMRKLAVPDDGDVAEPINDVHDDSEHTEDTAAGEHE